MFAKTQQQFISLYQTENQVKVGYQVYERGKLLVNQNSTVLSSKEVLPKELELIFQTKFNEIKDSYISTLLSASGEKFLASNESFNTEDYCSILLNEDYKIIVSKEEISKSKSFFANAGVDFIFSPTQILYQLFLDNQSSNTLSVLLYDDKFYSIFVSSDSKIFYFSEQMTKFSEISQSEFYEDEIKQQKLYDEVYYLELISKISKSIDMNKINVKNIAIYYDLKQLSSVDLQNLKNHFLASVSYKKANILDVLLDFSQNSNKYPSFISPRARQKQNIYTLAIGGVVVSAFIAFGVAYYFSDTPSAEHKRPVAPKVNYIFGNLPNHTVLNERIVKEITFLFESLPMNATLNSVVVDGNSSILACKFLDKNSFNSSMKEKLGLFYKESKLSLKNNKSPFEVSINNNIKLDAIVAPKDATKSYRYDKVFNSEDGLKIFDSYLPKDSLVVFEGESIQPTYKTFSYKVKYISNSPKEFFDFIELINKLNFSVYVATPVKFSKVEKGIEIELVVLFSQKN